MGTQPRFGERLKEQRRLKGLSQADLAGPGVSGSYVSLLESGRREPTHAVAQRLAERLGVDPGLLLRGVGAGTAQQARMDLAFAQLCLGQGDAEQAEGVLRRVIDGGGLAGDDARLFEARLDHARAQERLGALDRAVRDLEVLRAEAERLPAERPWLPVVVALSRCYREAGDLARAVDVAERAVERCDLLGLDGLDGHAEVVATLALAHFDRGDRLRASVLLDDLLARTSSSGREARAAAHWNAAVVASGRGEHAEALRLAEQASALIAESADDRSAARLLSTRAWILLNQNPPQPAEARGLLRKALPALKQHDSAGAVASAEVELSRAELLLCRPDAAREHAEKALALLGHEQPLEIARARAALGDAFAADGDARAATGQLDAAAELLSGLGATREAAGVWRRIGDASARLGKPEKAVAAYSRALDAAGLPAAPPPPAKARRRRATAARRP